MAGFFSELSKVVDRSDETVAKRTWLRSLRRTWSDFQRSSFGCFAFVETVGLLTAFQLVARSLRLPASVDHQHDGVSVSDREQCGPSLRGLNQQGFGNSRQVDLADLLF